MTWHLHHTDAALEKLGSDRTTGLSTEEAERRLQQYGPNELVEQGGRSPLRILWEQLTATMVLILLSAAVVALLAGDTKNSVAILSIVFLYALIGFMQEYRAEKAMAALKRMSVPTVRVIRDGVVAEVSSREVVPGDIVHVEAGNVVPADARLIEASNLHVQESALTGESEPVAKRTEPLADESLPLGDRTNMGYMGTTITRGRGRILVTATGMQTELGKIATLLQQTTSEPTPLQRRLDRLGKQLAVAGMVLAGVIFLIGMLQGTALRHMLLVAVSVAVAIVPEGLPAVVTITLALGAQRMLQRNALIRKLSAVEALGSVTTICSDKTGTLTENRMTVTFLQTVNHQLDVTHKEEDPVRRLEETEPAEREGLQLLLVGGALCNDAHLVPREQGEPEIIGDPTENALVAIAHRLGMKKSALEKDLPRVGEIPFDSERKRMSTIHRLERDPQGMLARVAENARYLLFTKGSVDGLLAISTHCLDSGRINPLDQPRRDKLLADNERLAGRGMRVIGVACRILAAAPDDAGPDEENSLTFIGMAAMIDPPRQEAADAVALARTAGIRTIMITGDHPVTAREICRQLGIDEQAKTVSGAELERHPVEELQKLVGEVAVFARVSPEHKLKIVRALQHIGQVVSMTGDGVNDAPALRRADIGVAMGITGTDVAKEAADLVLLDDNYATIVAAVREGRTIYDNVRKFVRFSVAGNTGKVLVMLLGPVAGIPLPLEPIQLLWLNLLTDGLLGMGMGVEPAEKGVMQRPPQPPGEGIFTRGAVMHTAWIGCLIAALALGTGAWYYYAGSTAWQTMIFTSLACAQTGQALAVRSGAEPLAVAGLFSNRVILAMVASVLLLQALVIYVPPLRSFFTTVPLGPADMAVACASGLTVFLAIELAKLRGNRGVTSPRT